MNNMNNDFFYQKKTKQEEEEDIWNDLTSDIFTITSGVRIISVLKSKKKDDQSLLVITGKNKSEHVSHNICTIKRIFEPLQNRDVYKIRGKYKLKRLVSIEIIDDNETVFYFGTDKVSIFPEIVERNQYIYSIYKIFKENYENFPKIKNLKEIEYMKYGIYILK
jgi:hypothetical protein